jgi:putative spermidine/putrescine transport system ATP-binding protein
MSKADAEAKVRRALEMVQMVEFGDRKPAQLSGGQQQRIALARALVFEPELVLMDEPLGALDKQLREHMQYEIKHIHESLGVTVVYVTHDQSEALTMSNRIAVFNDGIVQQLADPVTLYERPDNAFVAQFIGENNTLVGTVDAISGKKVTVDLGKHGKVQATRVVNVAKGDKTTLSISPGRIAFYDKTVRGKVSLPAKVMELIYLGDHIRCRMQVAGNDEFIAKIPNSNKPISLSPGNKGYVSWNIDDCRALDYS